MSIYRKLTKWVFLLKVKTEIFRYVIKTNPGISIFDALDLAESLEKSLIALLEVLSDQGGLQLNVHDETVKLAIELGFVSTSARKPPVFT